MKKPIFLVEENETINNAFIRMEELRKRHKEAMKKMEAEYDVENKICWETVENELVALGKIPDLEQSLSFSEGVIYLKDEEEEKKKSTLAEMFKKAICSLAD